MNHDRLIEKLAAEHVGYKYVQVRTAGEIRHIKDMGPQGRQFVKLHDFKAKDLKQLTKILWQISVALGHLSSCTNTFTRVKSVRISPDGMLGGKGYTKHIKDLRKELYGAIEALSSIQDCLHDEVNAEHWQPKVKEMPPKDQEDMEEMLEDVDVIRENPASYGDAQYEEEISDEEQSDESEFNLDSPLPKDEGA